MTFSFPAMTYSRGVICCHLLVLESKRVLRVMESKGKCIITPEVLKTAVEVVKLFLILVETEVGRPLSPPMQQNYFSYQSLLFLGHEVTHCLLLSILYL